jgi:arsenate reductase
MKKIYYLKTCDTCKRILNELAPLDDFTFQEIKESPITTTQIEEMHALAGSYEALFSKRAKLYKERDLKNEQLTEDDYKAFILEHYTFLKRPVIIFNEQIFIGNSKKNIASAKLAIHEQ